VKTANGEDQRILGKVIVRVVFWGREASMCLYLYPALKQQLYLGVDFWKEVNIAPELFGGGVEELVKSQPKEVTTVEPERHQLSASQESRLTEVRRVFLSYKKVGLGRTNLLKHRIELEEGAVPVKSRHYPMSPAKQAAVYAEVDEMLRLGVIKESESAWNNPVTLVITPGKNKLCLDARRVNKVTKKDAYPLQNIDGLLSRISSTIFISSVELKHAYWQIELEEEIRPITAFTVPGRPLYQFVVMPFGLCNAGQSLCRLMDKVIPSKEWAARSLVVKVADP